MKFPDAFGKETSWKVFKKVLEDYIRQMTRIHGILLEYVMCNNGEPGQTGTAHTADHESLVVTNPLVGEAFEADNCKDW